MPESLFDDFCRNDVRPALLDEPTFALPVPAAPDALSARAVPAGGRTVFPAVIGWFLPRAGRDWAAGAGRGPGRAMAPVWRALATADSAARSRSMIRVTSADSGSVPGGAMAEATASRIAVRSARTASAISPRCRCAAGG